jgi:hypothetical protein
MKANELRIGNWINRDSENEELRLWHFYKIAECVFDEDDLKPIPLTEEWLLKFGFKKIQGYICGEKIVYYYVKEDLEYDLTSGECMIENFTINLDKVHELQNLYFAIYSEELILKP